MALDPPELFGPENAQVASLRAFPYESGIRPGKLAGLVGAPELPHLLPLAYDETSDLWSPWDVDVVNEVYVITAGTPTATDGTFTLTVLGETTAAIAHDAVAATIDAALEALTIVPAGGVGVVDGGGGLAADGGTATISFTGGLAGLPVGMSADFALLVGSAHTMENTVDGSGAGTDQIDGFLWSPSHAFESSEDGERLVQILRRGQVHHDDIPLLEGSDESQAELTAALVDTNRLRTLGLDIVGVPGVH